MQIKVFDKIQQIPAKQWNALSGHDTPFQRYEFLSALESAGCIGLHSGWQAMHLGLFDEERLIGASPLYLKQHSYGEYVFDMAWANACYQAGINYYPKLVCTLPFTPVPGHRLLIEPEHYLTEQNIQSALIKNTLNLAKTLGVSSAHWLFATQAENAAMQQQGLLMRNDIQFIWRNADYQCFDDFLSSLSAKKRKNIRQERNNVSKQGIQIRLFAGNGINEDKWQTFFAFYQDTYHKRGMPSYLNLQFFLTIGQTMSNNLLLAIAYQGSQAIAGALFFHDEKNLYGRYWGEAAYFPCLHFETCYYQGIEYCIEKGLQSFHPGTQGQHKMARGFVPTLSESAHYIFHPRFRAAIEYFLLEECAIVKRDLAKLLKKSPYKNFTI